MERILRSRQHDSLGSRLQESERRYAELVEQAINGIVVRAPDGRLLLMNEAYVRMTGYSRAELLQLRAQDMVVDHTVLDRVAKLKPGESMRLQTLMKRKDGTLLDVDYVTQHLRDGNLQSVVLDVSERKNAERAHALSEQRYQELVEQAQEGIMVRRQSGELTYVNPELCRMLGYSRAELLCLNIRDLVHPDDADTIAQVHRLERGESVRLQKRLRGKDGRVLQVEVGAWRLADGDVQSTFHDLTARVHADRARRASEQRYAELVEQAADAIWLRDPAGRMVYANEAACTMLGYSRDELLQSGSKELVHESDRETSANIDALKPLETLRIERVMRHKDGHPIPVEASVHRLTSGDIQVISHDITERKRIEEELRQMAQRLLEAQEMERRAIARELHDEVGQALTATRINLGQLEKDAGDGPFAKRAGEASAMVGQLLQQVRQLSLDLHPSVLDDLGLAAALRWVVRTRTGGGGLQVTLELAENLPRFTEVVENTAFRVFQEAFSNVLRHSEAKQVNVVLERKGATLEIGIRDDGKGFEPEAARKHALDGKSLGVLGMRERVRLAGGHIEIESSAGRGTRIHAWLPASERKA